jgi:hypothetical protein
VRQGPGRRRLCGGMRHMGAVGCVGGMDSARLCQMYTENLGMILHSAASSLPLASLLFLISLSNGVH